MQAKEMRERLPAYIEYMTLQELSQHTIQKYRRDIRIFLDSTHGGCELEKQNLISYREGLMHGHKAASVNASIIALNRFFSWLGHSELTVKTIKIQRSTGHENIISPQEYETLLAYCLANNKDRNYLLLRSLAATGIRVGELKSLTYLAAVNRTTTVYNKGKLRTIFIPDKIAQSLISYCDRKGITQGAIFLGRGNAPLKSGSVWRMMKRTASQCGLDSRNIYPHSLRHLFAKTYMERIGNIFELADLLGHSSIETTRIYALSSQNEKMKSVNLLGL